jgi:hypothetical protein
MMDVRTFGATLYCGGVVGVPVAAVLSTLGVGVGVGGESVGMLLVAALAGAAVVWGGA